MVGFSKSLGADSFMIGLLVVVVFRVVVDFSGVSIIITSLSVVGTSCSTIIVQIVNFIICTVIFFVYVSKNWRKKKSDELIVKTHSL